VILQLIELMRTCQVLIKQLRKRCDCDLLHIKYFAQISTELTSMHSRRMDGYVHVHVDAATSLAHAHVAHATSLLLWETLTPLNGQTTSCNVSQSPNIWLFII